MTCPRIAPGPLSMVLCGVWAAAVVAQVPPDERWRSLETAHFRVTFPAELEGTALRAAERAERAYDLLSGRFVKPPEAPVELLVTDHADRSSGFASAVPYNQITVFVRPPMEGYSLAYFDDWLELVITHELVHVFHLDYTGPLGSLVRRVLGRSSADWPLFPGYDVPAWISEGMATYFESALTGSGRVGGSFHDMILRTAVLEDRFEGLDQASGLSPTWPAGIRPYVYGASFVDHLLEEYGEGRVVELVDAIARQLIPWRLNSGARQAFGVSFEEAWTLWRRKLEVEYTALADSLASYAPLTEGELLTTQGRRAFFPRVSPDGSRLAYVRADGRTDLQLRVANADGTAGRRLSRLNNIANFAWFPDGALLVAQEEYTDPYRIRLDLLRVDSAGSERRLTRGGRLDQPTLGPEGRSAVAVQDGEATNRLVRVDLATGEIEPLTAFEAGEHWAYPAWSPDGRWLAASRWRPGASYDLFILDALGRIVHRVTDDRAIDQAAAWSPDGRWLLWSSDRSGIPNLYAVAIDPSSGAPGALRQITNLLGGGAYPTVDPKAEWIYFSSYQVQGWDVARIPFDPNTWFEPLPLRRGYESGGEAAAERFARQVTATSRSYRALSTLAPRAWEPILRSRVTRQGKELLPMGFGARIGGRDLVGRHAYALEGVVRENRRADLGLYYTYAGWLQPFLGGGFTQSHSVDGPFSLESAADTVQVFRGERERTLRGTATWIRQRMRTRSTLSMSAAHVWDELELFDEDLRTSPHALLRPNRRLGEVAASATFSNARSYAFSTSGEAGVAVLLRLRARHEFALPGSLRGVAGSDRGFREVTSRVRGYHAFSGPGFSRHVVAWRASLGAAAGPGADRFHFDLGGAHGRQEHLTGLKLFGGTPLLFPVRGYATGWRTGRYAWTASLEYRFPIQNAHRGWRLFPLHIDRVSGSLFADAGAAWGDSNPEADGPHPRRAPLGSVGAEIQVSALALFNTRMFFRLGAALGLDGEGNDPLYLRLGTAF